MCGIAGHVSKSLPKGSVKQMCNVLAHRGPDADGFFYAEGIALGHRRLSIIDLSVEANQPFYSTNGEWVIVFNGEIYNYKELRSALEQKGHTFQTQSDTEVVLQSFERYGLQAVHDFIGMFAFAIYHRPTDTLYVFRDRAGVKPLYYYYRLQEFWFSSELKAIIPLLPERSINAWALADYFRFGYIRSPYTIFENVHKLPAGHFLRIQSGKLSVEAYWRVEDKIGHSFAGTEEEASDQLESILRSSFNYRMVADVPVGVFLSGGIDSSTLTAILSKDHSNLKTFSIGFDHPKYNEAPYARKIAEYLGTNHHEAILTVKDAGMAMEQYFSIYDEPFADSSGIPVYLISLFAKQNGCKVVLSADGGDELFGGYDRYRALPKVYERIRRNKLLLKAAQPAMASLTRLAGTWKNLEHRGRKLSSLLQTVGDGFNHSFYESYLSISSDFVLQKLIEPQFFPNDMKTQKADILPAETMMLWDFKHYLPDDLLTKVDRASMAASIEAREPFLDHRLIEFAFNLPLQWRLQPDAGKYLLRKVLYKYIPPAYFNRPKMGFSIPLFKWFSEKIDDEFRRLFTKEVLNNIPVLNSGVVLSEYKKYLHFKAKGKEYNVLMMWHLYVFVKWWERWM